jgi:hypothetical protein
MQIGFTGGFGSLFLGMLEHIQDKEHDLDRA